MKIRNKHIIIAILLLILIAIRLFEKEFFNDGLITFFQYDYLHKSLPAISISHILFIDSIRFWLNTFISIGILYLLFHQKGIIRFLSLFYGTIYIILITTMWYLLSHYEAGEYLALFYVRRFVIQPVLLFILIPALLYQKEKNI